MAAIPVGPEPQSRWSARSEVRTNDLDGRRSVELLGDGHHGHGMWLVADLRMRLIRRYLRRCWGAVGGPGATEPADMRAARRELRCGLRMAVRPVEQGGI